MTLTVKDIKDALPVRFGSSVTQEFVDQVNGITSDPLVAERIKEGIIDYAAVLQSGKFSVNEYLNAVTYVTYKHMGMSNVDSYAYTFPDRYNTLVANGATDREISSYVHAYSRTKLVVGIMEQALVPMWLINQDVYQKAINTQARLMMTAKSEKVQCDAANSILTHLAKPKDAITNINVDMRENTEVRDLQYTLRQLALQQQALINAGVSTRTITESNLIREVEDVDS